ncbi:MAG: PEP-CTERM sorting domain-containing protein [Phycisphaerales bacterium]
MALHTTISISVLALVTASASAQPLTGSGSHLPIPNPNPGAPANQVRSVTLNSGGFTGTWTAPALSPWIGTFSAIGPVPGTSSSSPGATLYDFSTMPAGTLPTGTYFRFGDVDNGASLTETFVLQAFDSSGVVTAPWLDVPLGATGGGLSPTAMPAWNFDAVTGAYTFDGTSVVGNPNVAFYLSNNIALTGLEVQRSTTFSTFSLHAPIPTPGSLALVGLGGIAAVRRRRS